MIGDVFSKVHGDLVTQLVTFNKEKKGTSALFRSGFSANINIVNTWVNTIHIHTRLKVALRQQLHHKTSSKHKELTESSKEMHSSHVESLKKNLSGYGIDPPTLGCLIKLSSGETNGKKF